MFWKKTVKKPNIFVLRYILVDLNLISPMKPSEFIIPISVESYDEKTAENYWNCNVAEKRIASKLSEISIPNFKSTNWRLEWSQTPRRSPFYLFLTLLLYLLFIFYTFPGAPYRFFPYIYPNFHEISILLSLNYKKYIYIRICIYIYIYICLYTYCITI